MKKIWKYEIPITATFSLELPFRADILSFQMQKDQPCIWVRFYSLNTATEKRKFEIIATGQDHGEWSEYIGTVIIDKDVWHLFEITT